jgi:hypothetical protein
MKQLLIEKYIEPSEVIININSVIERWLDRNGELHSFMGQPSVIRYENGQINAHSWHKKDKLHRDNNLPSVIWYNQYEQTIRKDWFKKHVLHRDEDMPAVICYDENGKIKSQDWYKNGEFVKTIDKTNETNEEQKHSYRKIHPAIRNKTRNKR